MSGQIKTIEEIILHKDDGLTRAMLNDITDKIDKIFSIATEKKEPIPLDEKGYERIKNILLKVDNTAVGLDPYDEAILSDINRGHWDIYRRSQEADSSITFKLPEGKTFQARSPLLDVKNGTVAIDFGTKSTVAGFINEKSTKQLIRIGKGNRKLAEKNDYENPTIMEFVDIESFMQRYKFCKSRPFTALKDICVSHLA